MSKTVNHLTLIFVLLICSASYGKLSKNEFLSRLDKKDIALEKATMFNTTSSVTEEIIKRQKAKYSNFKPTMWYYHYHLSDNCMHSVYYDWVANECYYAFFNMSEIEKNPRSLDSFTEGKTNSTNSASREKIEIRYCEKLYNFYSK